MTKICTKCGAAKELLDFPKNGEGRRACCKACHTASVIAWQKSHPELEKARQARKRAKCPESAGRRVKRYRLAHREELCARAKVAYQKHRATRVEASRAYRLSFPNKARASCRQWREKNKGYMTQWAKARKYSHPAFKLLSYVRVRVYNVLRGFSRSAPTLELLGCSPEALKAHIEAQFRSGMLWENYGSVWHLDHIKPCAAFDFTSPHDQQACFHYTNLQPLFAVENLKKGSLHEGARY